MLKREPLTCLTKARIPESLSLKMQNYAVSKGFTESDVVREALNLFFAQCVHKNPQMRSE